MNITITKKENPGKLPETDELGFGKYFTDHMFLMDYSDTDGWHNARIVPFGPVSMSPAAGVLHYGAEVFEGLKGLPPSGRRRAAFPPLGKYGASEPLVRPYRSAADQ